MTIHDTYHSGLTFLLKLYRRTEQAELDLIAAGVAFFVFLAIFPAVAAIIAIWGTVYDPSVISTQIELLQGFLPPEAFALVVSQVDSLLAVRGPQLGWTTLFSTLLALWSARAGVAALIRGLNAIYHLPNRPGGRHQLRAIFLTLVLIGLALAAMIATVVAPIIIGFLPVTVDTASWLHYGNLALGLVLLVLAISIAYRAGPNHMGVRPPLFSLGLLVAGCRRAGVHAVSGEFPVLQPDLWVNRGGGRSVDMALCQRLCRAAGRSGRCRAAPPRIGRFSNSAAGTVQSRSDHPNPAAPSPSHAAPDPG